MTDPKEEEVCFLDCNFLDSGVLTPVGHAVVKSKVPKHLVSHILPKEKVASLLAASRPRPRTDYPSDLSLDRESDELLAAKERGEMSSSELFDEEFRAAQTGRKDHYER